MANVYFMEFENNKHIVAETEDEAQALYLDYLKSLVSQLESKEMSARFVSTLIDYDIPDSPFVKKHANAVAESMYLDTGITRGIV